MNSFIQTIKLLDTDQLKTVNEYIDTLPFTPNTVFGSDGNGTLDTSVRSSMGTYLFDNHPVTNIIHDALNKGLIEYKNRIIDQSHIAIDGYPVPGAFMTSSHREGIQILDYTEGQNYNWHCDASTDPNSSFYHRKISIVLYLSNNFEGGHTAFCSGSYKPSAGCALFFPSNWCFPHRSLDVTSGKKRVAVTWYYTKDLKV